jgi:hypothetical protein
VRDLRDLDAAQGLGDGHAAAVEAMLRRIVLLDRVAHKDYPCMFAAADAFVLATHGEGEDFAVLSCLALSDPASRSEAPHLASQ